VKLLQLLPERAGLTPYARDEFGQADSALAGWERHETTARISSGRGTGLRTEVVWLNPACSSALERKCGGLFAAESVA